MMRTARRVYLEPGDLALLAQAARELAADRLPHGRLDPEGVILAEIAEWMERLLASSTPPGCLLRQLTSAEAITLARRIGRSGS